MRSARSSVVRATREISDTTMMPAMNIAEMAMPSGFSDDVPDQRVQQDAVSIPKPVAALPAAEAAETVTANAPETIIARMPVA
jgi:hypothetical protein